MTDIFREVDDDLRRAKLETLWQRRGNLIIALVLLMVAATAGWQGWRYWRGQQSEAAGARFEQAIEAARAGRPEDAEKIFGEIGRDAPPGYRLLARFRSAAELSKRDRDAGVAAYDALANDSGLGTVMQDLARLRAAILIVDAAPSAELARRLQPLASPNNPWRHTARELIAVAAIKGGDYETAGRMFDAIIVDGQSPPVLRARADVLAGLVRAGPVPVKAP